MKELLTNPLDLAGIIAWLVFFPGYHIAYALWIVRRRRTHRGDVDDLRLSWFRRVINDNDRLPAVHHLRNLTMMVIFLTSSTLILMGLFGQLLVGQGSLLSIVGGGVDTTPEVAPERFEGVSMADPMSVKLITIFLVFGFSFFFFLASLRHMGYLTIVLGAEPEALARKSPTGEAADFLAGVMGRVSQRYTLGMRGLLFSAPLILWLLWPPLFPVTTLALAAYLIFHHDF